MSRAKRKDEWQRAAALYSLIANRTNFSGEGKPLTDLDCMPQWLVTNQDRLAAERAKRAAKVTVTAMEIAGLMGVELPMPTFDELYPADGLTSG